MQIQNTIDEIIQTINRIQLANNQNNLGAIVDQEQWMLDSTKLTELVDILNTKIKMIRDVKIL
jgi:hypothetical protein